ncbi:hypothetical protein skT53_29780 [Effusibacillus dendaii]|uniref:LysR substrate-binding domain-containing protein n=1 Tax=Effusibacillus dendaii TaxID=2743772 RepID=A0A7I8DCR6_9BACL|nr:hypothetical protein skT53_29780 [Effusibacillus dendaii]
MILPQSPCDIRDPLEAGFQKHDVAPLVSFEAPLNESILSYSANGMGISFVPEMVVSHVSLKNIVYKKIKGNPVTRTIHLFSRTKAVFDRFYSSIPNKRNDT